MPKRIALIVALGLLLAGCVGESRGPATKGNRIAIAVTDSGFVPGTVTVRAGEPVTLVVTRTTDQTCAKDIVFTKPNIRRELPLDRVVEITFTPTEKGELRYSCGMDMIAGTLKVE